MLRGTFVPTPMILTFLDLLYHAFGVLLADIVDDDVGTETSEH
jgi:hypothetical protein